MLNREDNVPDTYWDDDVKSTVIVTEHLNSVSSKLSVESLPVNCSEVYKIPNSTISSNRLVAISNRFGGSRGGREITDRWFR